MIYVQRKTTASKKKASSPTTRLIAIPSSSIKKEHLGNSPNISKWKNPSTQNHCFEQKNLRSRIKMHNDIEILQNIDDQWRKGNRQKKFDNRHLRLLYLFLLGTYESEVSRQELIITEASNFFLDDYDIDVTISFSHWFRKLWKLLG